VEPRLILVTLLVKLGVAAAVASALARSRRFKSILFIEDRTLSQQLKLVLFIGLPFALGVVVRVMVRNFLAADLGFESAILMGVIGGRLCGLLGGVFVALPAVVAPTHEYLTLPVDMLVGLIGGMLRNLAADHENIWGFSPFIDLSIYRWVRRNLPRPQMDWQILFFTVIVVLQFARMQVGRAFPALIFSLYSPNYGVLAAIFFTVVVAVAIPLKIWNNTRIELKLEEQERLLLQARMEALQSQINPHFLFNTLNSIASLVRFDQDTARELIVKLANILRRLLRKSEGFVQFRDEVEFMDDYLDIEVVRFGRDKLRVHKDLDPASLDVIVPSMLLQPLIENSIKHGLSPKIDGGSITLRSRIVDSNLRIEVEDDGVGIAQGDRMSATTGIGMANVAERLHVLYGDAAKLTITSTPGKGTLVALDIPILSGVDSAAEPGSVAAIVYEARSSTPR
jgi:two-component system LytT family sensor kinase